MAPSTTALTSAARRAALGAAVMQAVLDGRQERHPAARPDLGDIAIAAAELDGHPLAAGPGRIRQDAQAGDRDRALEMITDAERAVTRLEQGSAPGQRPFIVTPAHVALYRIGVHWSLGDAGAAVTIGRRLHPGQLPTPERRARLFTDLARAWWQWNKPEQTARALMLACQYAPAEVRDRPSIRDIVTQLAHRYPGTAGVRRLVATVRSSPVR